MPGELIFPSVLAVDDDPICLMLLENLLLRCHYDVLSANGDTKAVMKGISHGACDYLLKPIQIEELKNIWQHVVRRKKFDSVYQNKGESSLKAQLPNSEGVQGPRDRSGKLNRKRKDQPEEDEVDSEENTHGNEDPSTQKKPRVVWSIDLHRKFVAAVNQLGVDSKSFRSIM